MAAAVHFDWALYSWLNQLLGYLEACAETDPRAPFADHLDDFRRAVERYNSAAPRAELDGLR